MGGRGEPPASSPARTELIDFTIERQRHRRFVGRDDVLAQLEEWLLGPGERACAVTPDGQRVVLASDDRTLKVWDLESGACTLTHRASAGFAAVTVTAISIIAADAAGALWFLDWPSPNRRESSNHDARGPDNKPTSPLPPRVPSSLRRGHL